MNVATVHALSINEFENGQLDPEQFDHEAHVRMGWLYAREYDLPEAINRFDAALQRLTTQLGVPGKYHATITWLFLILIAQRCDEEEDWQTFRSRNSDLVTDSGSTLHRYYSTELLFSETARRQFVLPDKLVA